MGTKRIQISDKAYANLKGLKRHDESFSETIIRIGSKNPTRASLVRRVCSVISGYSLAVWLYVIAYQMFNPDDVYDVLVWWLPIRMDYIAEVAFTLSFIFALIAATYHTTQR